jgi:hypothetical protein
MRIAGEFKATQWGALRKRLVAGGQAAWHEAVELLDRRIRGRYLGHARRLLDERYSGFAVLAIDSAVVEALEQFRRGKPHTPRGQSGAFFKTFLTQTRFKSHFTEARAKLLFDTIRCGILHQAEAKEDSLVKKGPAHPVAVPSKSGSGLVINARRFHDELEGAFEDYKKSLLDDTKNEDRDDRRTAFIRKMDAIARRPGGGSISGVVQPSATKRV